MESVHILKFQRAEAFLTRQEPVLQNEDELCRLFSARSVAVSEIHKNQKPDSEKSAQDIASES